jgi:hypothetical protein
MQTAFNTLTLSNMEARELASKTWSFNGTTYRFKDYDPAHPGQPPWRSGAEGKAFPLLASDSSVAAFIKFFARATPERLQRTAWLIGQQIHKWSASLAAAPLSWVDTRQVGRPCGISFDFAGALAKAVPGKTWLELKYEIADGQVQLNDDFRWRCLLELVRSVALLEQAGIIHGDLSPNNVIIDTAAPPSRPALYLIDFDAFVAKGVGQSLTSVNAAEGGTFGTPGYCPPDLCKRYAAGDSSVAPYSDHYGRDMLLLELLCFHSEFSPDEAPPQWDYRRLGRRFAALVSRSHHIGGKPSLKHLDPAVVFVLPEDRRPASSTLARSLGLPLPPAPRVRPAAPVYGATRVTSPPTARVQGSATSPSAPPSGIRTWIRRGVRQAAAFRGQLKNVKIPTVAKYVALFLCLAGAAFVTYQSARKTTFHGVGDAAVAAVVHQRAGSDAPPDAQAVPPVTDLALSSGEKKQDSGVAPPAESQEQTGVAQGTQHLEVKITRVSQRDGTIAGMVRGLKGADCGNYTILVLIKTDCYYPHPFVGSLAAIKPNGHWEVRHVVRGGEQRVAAVVLPRETKIAALTRQGYIPRLEQVRAFAAAPDAIDELEYQSEYAAAR